MLTLEFFRDDVVGEGFVCLFLDDVVRRALIVFYRMTMGAVLLEFYRMMGWGGEAPNKIVIPEFLQRSE